ncbi:MAG: ABC transporter ATP-binding protein [Candidatus Sungbacteria bacterium]|nr:ABC transporter ATP-binding protein [Candidatus Sungbacteria bacterium]
MNSIIEVKNLSKLFGGFTAVDNISFVLKEGEILGLLGPNGAGKTTTIQMLLGVLTPTKGEITMFGKEFFKYREEALEMINFSSTYTTLPWDLTVRENLTYISYLYALFDRKKRLQEITALFKLEDLLEQKISQLSAGQQTRVNLAKAFINFPKILLLDEPTASLDPDVAAYIREFLLQEQKKFGVSIILTSHNMAEVEELCDRIVFINKGAIVADDTPENLARSIKICHIEIAPPAEEFQKLRQHLEARRFSFSVEKRSAVINLEEQKVAAFLQELSAEGIQYEEISIEKPSLQDYFLQMTKTENHEAP